MRSQSNNKTFSFFTIDLGTLSMHLSQNSLPHCLNHFNLITWTENKIFKIKVYSFRFCIYFTHRSLWYVVLLVFWKLLYYLFSNCLKREKKNLFKISVAFSSGLKSHLLLDKWKVSRARSLRKVFKTTMHMNGFTSAHKSTYTNSWRHQT